MSKPHLLMPYALVAFTLAFAAGCSERTSASNLTAMDSAGVEILTSWGDGPHEDADWRLELDLEVGAADGLLSFGRVLDVAPRRAGGLWIVDGQARRVRGFDEEGRETLAFGRPGDGPGEFRSIGRIAERLDGSLRIGGRMPVELYAFDASGQPLGTTPLSPDVYREAARTNSDGPPLGPTLAEWQFTVAGMAFVQTTTIDASEGEVARRDALVRLEGGSAPMRLAAWEAPAMRGGVAGELLLLQPAASWSPLPDGGVWFAFGERYEIRRFDARGELRSILRRPEARVALTPEVEERFKSGLAEEAENPAMLAMLENAVFPDSLPAVAALLVSEENSRLWVGVMDPSRSLRLDEPNALDGFAFDGRYLGRLPIPRGFRPTRIAADRMYGVWRDELDVSYARRYRIIRGR